MTAPGRSQPTLRLLRISPPRRAMRAGSSAKAGAVYEREPEAQTGRGMAPGPKPLRLAAAPFRSACVRSAGAGTRRCRCFARLGDRTAASGLAPGCATRRQLRRPARLDQPADRLHLDSTWAAANCRAPSLPRCRADFAHLTAEQVPERHPGAVVPSLGRQAGWPGGSHGAVFCQWRQAAQPGWRVPCTRLACAVARPA